jgi:hypothetical protein
MTTSTSDPVPKDKLRPLSSATNLTDFTHSTVEPESELASDGEYDDLEVQSLSPSMYENEKKYGRTYHSFHAGAYPFPNDEVRAAWKHLFCSIGPSLTRTSTARDIPLGLATCHY